jgi:acyl-CoA thioester hydrolase
MGDIKNYSLELEVRDNEVDFQGIVNHANYVIYMAHARHKHLKQLDIDVDAMHKEGYNLILTHSEINYKASLKSGDEFTVTSLMRSSGKIRISFVQEIIRKKDSKVVTTAVNTGTCLAIATGRPFIPEKLQKIIEGV